MTKITRACFALFALAVVAVFATGCSNTQTFASQCAYQIEDGYFDARHVQDILHPGERKNTNNTKVRYVYCNARNYIVNGGKDSAADVKVPFEAKTGKDKTTGDGTPVIFEGSAHFSLNQNDPVLLQFLGFCEKYNCFASKDTDDNEGGRSASQGWQNMLGENFRYAYQRAVQVAMQQFEPDVWNDQSKWPAIGDAVSKELQTQLRKQIGIEDETNYFCGTGVKLVKPNDEKAKDAYSCPEISVNVDNIAPKDPGVKDIYNQEVRQQNLRKLAVEQKKTNTAVLDAARARYGSKAEEALMLIDACKEGGCPGRLPGDK